MPSKSPHVIHHRYHCPNLLCAYPPPYAWVCSCIHHHEYAHEVIHHCRPSLLKSTTTITNNYIPHATFTTLVSHNSLQWLCGLTNQKPLLPHPPQCITKSTTIGVWQTSPWYFGGGPFVLDGVMYLTRILSCIHHRHQQLNPLHAYPPLYQILGIKQDISTSYPP